MFGRGILISKWSVCNHFLFFVQKVTGRGRGRAEDGAQHRIGRCPDDEATSVSEGRVLVVRPDFCATSDLDLQPGL